MTSDYEDPASIPSCYGSMNSSRTTYKSTQLRRPYPLQTTKNLRFSRTSHRSDRNFNLYFAFILFVSSVNMAMLCYLIIAMETRCQQLEKQPSRPLPKVESAGCPEMDQLVSSINTMMNALTYTLPQVLTSNKHSLITRMNHLVMEIKDAVRSNTLDLSVRLGLNRTIALKTGSNVRKEDSVVNTSTRPTKPPWMPPVTLIPPKTTNRLAFYPLVRSEAEQHNKDLLQNVKNFNLHHNEKNGDLDADIGNMNPAFR
nr:MAG: transmembrane protein [Jeilongvirus beilongi]